MSESTHLTSTQRDSLRKLSESVIEYVRSLEQDTEELDVYLVGGALRDALLGKTPEDWDFLVVGETVTVLKDRRFVDINAASFGVLHDENSEEWALARTESKPDGGINTGEANPADKFGYKSIQTNTENVPLAKDLYRRDLTINSTALEITQTDIDKESFTEVLPDEREFEESICEIETEYGVRRFIDPFNARRDVVEGRIHPVSPAWTDDPLRALRAARYLARYAEALNGVPFTLTDEMRQMMQQVASELNLMSRDRIGEELIKSMKQAVEPSRVWNALQETGVLAVIAPALDRTRIIKPGPDKYHRETSTFTHTMAVVDRMAELCDEQGITGMDRVRRLFMALGHDLGKVPLADEMGGLWSDDPPTRFGGHAEAGKDVVAEICRQTGLPDHIKCAMMDGADLHMTFYDLPDWSPEDILIFVDDHTTPPEAETPYKATVDELLDLSHADHEGRMQALDVFSTPSKYTTDTASRWLPEQDDAARPVFPRERYLKRIKYAKNTLGAIDGYRIMQEELQQALDGDTKSEATEKNIVQKLERHDDCRSPGAWIGETIFNRKLELYNRQELYLG